MARKSKGMAGSSAGESRVESLVQGSTARPGNGAAGLESFADLGRDNLSVFLDAQRVLSDGLEAIGKELMDYARESFERSTQATSALLGARTFDELVQLNSDLARSSLGALIERSSRISELSVSLASEALAPFNSRVGATIAAFAKPPSFGGF